MYIEPNTSIKILKNCPLDTSYEHTIYFSNLSNQYSYFNSLTKYTFPRNTYQRVNRGYLRIEVNAENIYDCNYLMFQNTAYGNKWFYAFIESVEYINDRVTEVRFKIDVMQTWFFDYTLEKCFVEREHTSTDVIGENTVNEGIDTGDYIYDTLGRPDAFTGLYDIVVCTTFNVEFDQSTGEATITDDGEGDLYGNVYSGLKYQIFSSSALGSINKFLQKVTDGHNESGIVSIYMVPHIFTTAARTQPATWYHTVNKNITRLGTYTPRNKKLFCYPYNMLHVIDNNGNCADYHFEYFSTNNCQFQLAGTMAGQPEAQICPMMYKGISGKNENEKMVINDFPQCAYTIDSFRAWLAQNKWSAMTSILTGVVGIGAAFATGGLTSAGAVGALSGASAKAIGADALEVGASGQALSSASNIGGILSQGITAYTLPPHAKGATTGALNMAMRQQGFTFFNAYVRPEYARIIDDYFDRFGYACRRNKVPNRNVRPHWTYTKTVACTIVGSMPCDDEKTICAIYDKGITFWKNGSEVGNYSLDNKV